MYAYKTLDSKKVQDVEKYANDMTKKGWELMQVLATDDRYVSIFRKEVEAQQRRARDEPWGE